MNKYKEVLFYDRDVYFTDSIRNYYKNAGMIIECLFFSDIKGLWDYVKKKGEYIGLIVISEKYFSENKDNKINTNNRINKDNYNGYGNKSINRLHDFNDINYLVLCEDKDVELVSGFRTIYKYQAASLIFRDIYDECARCFDDKKSSSIYQKAVKGKVISLYSLLGEKEKIKALKEVINIINGNGSDKKILFVDMSFFSALDVNSNHTLSDILYYIRLGNKCLDIKLNTIIKKDLSRFDLIGTCNNPNDLKSIKKEEIKYIAEEILKMDIYDFIIFNLDASLFEFLDIFKDYEGIYLVCDNKNGMDKPLVKFMNYIENTDKSGVLDYIKKVYV